MDVHASPAELPELQDFLGAFLVSFRRPESAEALQRYTTGLLTELPIKNYDTMAQAVPGTSEQRPYAFLTNMPWDEADLNRQRVQKMMAEATLCSGVLGLDDTGFTKQGKTSVGVAREYSGTLGQVGNGQMAVACCDTDPQTTRPVAVRLYLQAVSSLCVSAVILIWQDERTRLFAQVATGTYRLSERSEPFSPRDGEGM